MTVKNIYIYQLKLKKYINLIKAKSESNFHQFMYFLNNNTYDCLLNNYEINVFFNYSYTWSSRVAIMFCLFLSL